MARIKPAISKSHGAPHKVRLEGGPWDGLVITTRIPYGDTTLPIKVGEFKGQYRMKKSCYGGVWENV